jgi:hypothetical protein
LNAAKRQGYLQGILTEGTVDLLIKVACFVAKVNDIFYEKELI